MPGASSAGSSTDPVASGGDGVVPTVKIDRLTIAELAQAELEIFKSSAEATMTQLQGHINSLNSLHIEAKKDDMTENIATAFSKLSARLVKLQKGLLPLTKGGVIRDKDTAKLNSTIKKALGEMQALEAWAEKLGVSIPGLGGKKRKRER